MMGVGLGVVCVWRAVFEEHFGTHRIWSSMRKDKFNYEFGGPVGALATMICLPLLTLLLTYWASVGRIAIENILPEEVCLKDVNSLSSIVGKFKASNVLCPSCTEPPVLVACAFVILMWFLFQAVSSVFLSWLHHFRTKS